MLNLTHWVFVSYGEQNINKFFINLIVRHESNFLERSFRHFFDLNENSLAMKADRTIRPPNSMLTQ
jgi:hypothetical protein